MPHLGWGRPGDLHSTDTIRKMRLCSRACPAFAICPLMPLSIQPVAPKMRVCLLNEGPEELKSVYLNLFVHGEGGVIDEIKGTVLEYGKILRETKSGMTAKERMKHIKELNGMMVGLHKILSGTGDGGDSAGERVEVQGSEEEDSEEEDQDPESLQYSEVVNSIFKKEAEKKSQKV